MNYPNDAARKCAEEIADACKSGVYSLDASTEIVARHFAEVVRERDEARSYIALASRFGWAHEEDCPRYQGHGGCLCGLDEFLRSGEPMRQRGLSLLAVDKERDALKSTLRKLYEAALTVLPKPPTSPLPPGYAWFPEPELDRLCDALVDAAKILAPPEKGPMA